MRNLISIFLIFYSWFAFSQGFDVKNYLNYSPNYNGLYYEGNIDIAPHASFTLNSSETLFGFGAETTFSVYNNLPTPGSGRQYRPALAIRDASGTLQKYLLWNLSAIFSADNIIVEAIVPDLNTDQIYFVGTLESGNSTNSKYLITGKIDNSYNINFRPLALNTSNDILGKNLLLLPNGDVFVVGQIESTSYPSSELIVAKYSPSTNTYVSVEKIENFDIRPTDLLFDQSVSNNIIISAVHNTNYIVDQCDGYSVDNQLCVVDYDYSNMKVNFVQLINSGGYFTDVFTDNYITSAKPDESKLLNYFNLSDSYISREEGEAGSLLAGVFNGSNNYEGTFYTPILYNFEYTSDSLILFSSMQLSGINPTSGEYSNLFNPDLFNTVKTNEIYITSKTFESSSGVGSAKLNYSMGGIVASDYFKHDGLWGNTGSHYPYGNYSASYSDVLNSVNFEVANLGFFSADNINYIHANKREDNISLCSKEYDVNLTNICSHTKLIHDIFSIPLIPKSTVLHTYTILEKDKSEIKCSTISNRKKQGSYDKRISEKLLCNVFPNPNNGEFVITIKSDISNRFNLYIKNMLGQEVYSESIVIDGVITKKLSLSNLEKGVYFISVSNEKEQFVKKFILK